MDFSLIWEKLIDSIELCWVIVRGFRRFEFGVDYLSVVVCKMLKNKNRNGISIENGNKNETLQGNGKKTKIEIRIVYHVAGNKTKCEK